jgi:ABC-type nitrate/sulfonate/bicarbonate transport system permease component
MTDNRWLWAGARVLLVAAVIGLWQLLCSSGVLDPITVSSPAVVWDEITGWTSGGSLWPTVLETLATFAIGYGLGVGAGIVIGVAMGMSETVRMYLDPFIVFFNAVPKLVLVPLMIAWLGFTRTPGVIVVFLVVVFLVAVTVHKGMDTIGGEFIDNARMLGAGTGGLVRDVYLPAVAIWVMTSARLAVGLAFQAAVVAEFFGSGHGLGYLIVHGEQTFSAAQIWGAIVVTVALAWLIDFLLSILDRRVSRWVPA